MIKRMWLQEPDPSAPDLVVEDSFECPSCGFTLTVQPSYPRTVTLRTVCPCGTDVEIVQAAHIDGQVSDDLTHKGAPIAAGLQDFESQQSDGSSDG